MEIVKHRYEEAKKFGAYEPRPDLSQKNAKKQDSAR